MFQKGIIQCFHLEISLPLLEEILPESEIVDDFVEEEEEEAKSKKGKKKKGVQNKPKKKKDKKSKGSRKKSKSGKSSKGKKSSPYEAPDEYQNERKLRIKNNSFKTERFPWAKVIQLPEEALVVKSPEEDFSAVRDTFQTRINVKLIYQKILPPQKPSKNRKTSKKPKKKSKKSSKKKKSDKKTKPVPEDKKLIEKKEPREMILKKVTLANFYCDLHDVNWSDKTIDYYWADHPTIQSVAVSIDGSLKAIHYIEKKTKKGKETKTSVSNLKRESIPNRLTCEIGFGLKRNYTV